MKSKKSFKKQEWLVAIGKNVRKARENKHLSQEKLALLADLDRSYVGGVERGERNISAINLKKVADALGLSVASLLQEL